MNNKTDTSLGRLTVSIRLLDSSQAIESSLGKSIPKSRNRVLDSIPTFDIENRVDKISIYSRYYLKNRIDLLRLEMILVLLLAYKYIYFLYLLFIF